MMYSIIGRVFYYINRCAYIFKHIGGKKVTRILSVVYFFFLYITRYNVKVTSIRQSRLYFQFVRLNNNNNYRQLCADHFERPRRAEKTWKDNKNDRGNRRT